MKYRNFRIQTKLLLSYLIVIIITVTIVGYLSYSISTREVINNTKAFSLMLIDQLSVNIPNRAKNFEQSSYAVQSNRDFLSLLSQDMTDASGDQLYLNQKAIQAFLIPFFGLSRDVRQVIVQSNNGQIYWSEEFGFFGSQTEMDEQQARDTFAWVNQQQTHYEGVQSIWLPSRDPDEIIFTRKIINSQTLKTVGRISIFLNREFLEANHEWKNENIGGSVAILNRNGNILYAEADTNSIIKAWLNDTQQQLQGQTTFSFKGHKYYISHQFTENRKWGLILIIPVSELLRTSDKLGLYLLITCAAALLVTVIIAFGISKQMTRPIRKLERTMRRVEEGDFSVQVIPINRDEIGLLSIRFNAMVTRINELIHHLYVETLAKQQAEFQVLKAQIQPHFLYNTLGSIRWLAKMNKQETIAEMVNNLIDLLRASVNKKGDFITVQEELEYINSYFSIQKFRFENRFRVDFDIEDGIRSNQMLNFILQPLVENALLHGIEMSKDNGVIRIRAYCCKEELRLEVEDNGVGMSEDQLQSLLTQDADNDIYSGLHSIGISNVNARIKLYCGEPYGLQYRSELGKGTIATIRLPLQGTKGE